MSTILEVQNLKKYFQTPHGQLHAVDDVSFSVEKGQTLGVVGESGCGKSTLGRLIVRLLDSTEGKIFFENNEITHAAGKDLIQLRKKIQMIFQDPYASLDPRKTIADAIGEPYLVAGGLNSAQIEERVLQMMDTVGLARRLYNSYPHELDGGRRQRIGIARALTLDPQLVICDEPVSALDVSIQAQILNLMLDLQEQRQLTYLFITHDLSVIKYISNWIIVMYLGKIVEMSDTKTLFREQLHPYTQALISAVPKADIHHKRDRIVLKGEISSPINPKDCCRFAVRCNHACKRCFEESPQLKEVSPNHFVACHLYD